MKKTTLCLIFPILLNTVACLTLKKQSPKTEIFKIDHATLKPDQFSDYIIQLTNAIQSIDKPIARKRGMLLMARACVYHRNPHPDYAKALGCYQEYLNHEKDNESNPDIRNWVRVLSHIQHQKKRLEDMKENLTVIRKKNQILAENIRKQDTIIWKLESKLKKLDALYFQFERKKKKKNQDQQDKDADSNL